MGQCLLIFLNLSEGPNAFFSLYSMSLLPLWLNKQNWISYQFTCLQVLDFLKAKDTFISLLLKHLGTSAIMDLMLKLMTQVEGVEMRQNILNVSTGNIIPLSNLERYTVYVPQLQTILQNY